VDNDCDFSRAKICDCWTCRSSKKSCARWKSEKCWKMFDRSSWQFRESRLIWSVREERKASTEFCDGLINTDRLPIVTAQN
jgi:hypothetical protein